MLNKVLVFLWTFASIMIAGDYSFDPGDMQGAKDEASTLNQNFKGAYRGKDNINAKIYSPSTSQEDLVTMDNTKIGKANLSCKDTPNAPNCQKNGNSLYTSPGRIPSEEELKNQAYQAQREDNLGVWSTVEAGAENEDRNPVSESDLSDIKTVAKSSSQATVNSSDPNSINYTLKYKDENGNWTEIEDSSRIEYDTEEEDAKSCMVEWDEVQTVSQTTGKVFLKTEIRECENNFKVCPVKANERIKYDCGRINDSKEEVEEPFRVMNEVVKDISCSSN